MMKRWHLLFIVTLGLVATTVIFAGQDGYPYFFPCYTTGCAKPQHNIWGATLQPGTAPVYSKTYRFVITSGGPNTYDKLTLQTRVWEKQNNNCPLVRVADVVGTCTACNHAPLPSHPNYSSFSGGTMQVYPLYTSQSWYAVSKHRLVHTGATNGNGVTPNPFYTEVSVNTSTKPVFRGSRYGCGINPSYPDED